MIWMRCLGMIDIMLFKPIQKLFKLAMKNKVTIDIARHNKFAASLVSWLKKIWFTYKNTG